MERELDGYEVDERTLPNSLRLALREEQRSEGGSSSWFYGGHSGPLGLEDGPAGQAELRRLERDFLAPAAPERWRPSWERDRDEEPERSAWRAWLEDPAVPAPDLDTTTSADSWTPARDWSPGTRTPIPDPVRDWETRTGDWTPAPRTPIPDPVRDWETARTRIPDPVREWETTTAWATADETDDWGPAATQVQAAAATEHWTPPQTWSPTETTSWSPAEQLAPAERLAPDEDWAPAERGSAAEQLAPIEKPAPAEDWAPAERWAPTEPATSTEAWAPAERWLHTVEPAATEAWAPAERWAPASTERWAPVEREVPSERSAATASWGPAERGAQAWAPAERWGPVEQRDRVPAPVARGWDDVPGLDRQDRVRVPRGAIRTGWGHPVMEAVVALNAAPAVASITRPATAAEPWDDWGIASDDQPAPRRRSTSTSVVPRPVTAAGSVAVMAAALAVGGLNAWVFILWAGVGGAYLYGATLRGAR